MYGWSFRSLARGRPRRRHVPDVLSLPAQAMLAAAKWRAISWRTGTKGKLKARFAAVRVRVADGPPQRIRDKGQQHLPGEEAWLIGEHRMSGEKKYYLANLPAKTDLRTLAATIKARWICEQAHQQLKEELGLDHFEGRSWQGLHRHALMTMIAYAFLQHRRLKTARREKEINGPPPQPTLPAVRQAILELIARPPPQRCPHCRKWICKQQQRKSICQSSARPHTHKICSDVRLQSGSGQIVARQRNNAKCRHRPGELIKQGLGGDVLRKQPHSKRRKRPGRRRGLRRIQAAPRRDAR